MFQIFMENGVPIEPFMDVRYFSLSHVNFDEFIDLCVSIFFIGKNYFDISFHFNYYVSMINLFN